MYHTYLELHANGMFATQRNGMFTKKNTHKTVHSRRVGRAYDGVDGQREGIRWGIDGQGEAVDGVGGQGESNG